MNSSHVLPPKSAPDMVIACPPCVSFAARRTCSQVIGNESAIRYRVEGPGFGRRTLADFICPACGAARVLRVSSRSGGRSVLPPGGFVCGALLPTV